MLQPSRLNRAISKFRQVYEANVSQGQREFRVSELLEKDAADWRRRDGELHPSSFPFCGLRHAYERLHRDDDPVITHEFGRDYFLNAGHVFHAALQRWMGHSEQMIGDWKCKACGAMHRFKTIPVKGCRRCGSQHLEYRELGGHWGKNVHWHSDNLWKQTDSKLWVIDYKSTSTYAIEQHRKTKQVFPYVSNRFQIESYIPLLEDTYDIEIAGWMLVYAARDNPNHMFKVEVVGGEVDDDRKAELRERLHQADKDFSVTLKVKEQPIKVMRRLEQTKLCEDKDFYDHFVHDKYNPCPLSKVCFGSKLKTKFLEAPKLK